MRGASLCTYTLQPTGMATLTEQWGGLSCRPGAPWHYHARMVRHVQQDPPSLPLPLPGNREAYNVCTGSGGQLSRRVWQHASLRGLPKEGDGHRSLLVSLVQTPVSAWSSSGYPVKCHPHHHSLGTSSAL